MRRPALGCALLAALAVWAACSGTRGFVLPRLGAHDGLARPSSRRVPPTSGLAAAADDRVPASPEASAASMEEAAASAADAGPAPEVDVSSSQRDKLKVEVLRIASASSRGERASAAELDAARTAIESLEALNPTGSPTLAQECLGTWELVFADTQLFRSSPFFMAGRALCREGDEAARYDWFCDMHRAALQFTNIGKVRQVVSPTSIVSEFEVQVGAAPVMLGYPLNIDGAIVSTANIAENRGDGFELMMEKVEIKGSNVPLLRQALDGGLMLRTEPVGRALEPVVSDRDLFPTPLFRTTFLDSELRISRDQDGKLFVYSRVSDSTTPTDYEDATADLGIPSLLDGAVSTIFR
mmetsp:Transcript_50674/g.156859  ORF Transcript_50674/g.156859 Transcript_50674/m.156859 type:complete len:354 (-) Transcript_50674:132-1193(-)